MILGATAVKPCLLASMWKLAYGNLSFWRIQMPKFPYACIQMPCEKPHLIGCSEFLPFWHYAASFHLSVSQGGYAIRWLFWLPTHTKQFCTTRPQVQHVIIETGVQERDEAAWRPWQTSLNFLNRSTWKDEGHVDIQERSTNFIRKWRWKAAIVTGWLSKKCMIDFEFSPHQNIPKYSNSICTIPPIHWAVCHIYARLGRSWCLKWSQSRHTGKW